MANDNNPKRRLGALKAPLEFMPVVAEALISLVLENGAKKYGAFNWRKEGISMSTYVGAVRRHVGAIADGEYFDEDSGYPHWAHIAASAAIALDADALGKLVDDIKLPGDGPRMMREIHRDREEAAKVEVIADAKAKAVDESIDTWEDEGGPPAAGDLGRDNDWPKT